MKKINIDLSAINIEKMEYRDCIFESSNRQTFVKLKNLALKQHDKIKALEFHKQECQTHLKHIKINNQKNGDKIILGFESGVSDFGTNICKPIVWFICLSIAFYLYTGIWSVGSFNPTFENFINFIIPINYDIEKLFETDVIYWVGRLLFLLYKIVQLIMIYEIIKSFRKFSRNL